MLSWQYEERGMQKSRFSVGEIVVLREIWDGKIWAAHPCYVIQDTSELFVVYRPAGTISKLHRSLSGGEVSGLERKNKEWVLDDACRDDIWILRMTIPGETYSVIAFWNTVDNGFRCWYINLEDKARRNGFCIDYTDLLLDLIIDPNLKDWYWDDTDELQEAIELGIISLEQSKSLYNKGQEIRDLIMSGKSIFNQWGKWCPNPNWKPPILPEGWDIIQKFLRLP
jgi:predicted RNA-binding protein associated with RNAse of E/G family